MPDLVPELQPIPGGPTAIGDLWGDGEADERPVRELALADFALGRYPVTNAQFALFLNESGALRRPGPRLADVRARAGALREEAGLVRCREGREQHPVAYVPWRGARAYCAWLRERTGRPFRLPTEAEWQHAAQGPRRVKWALGETFEAERYVCRCGGSRPVGGGAPSALGLFDVTGNVFEWTEDEYAFSLAPEAARLARHRIIKGGAFILGEAANLRNARRFSCHEESCLACVGFRVAAGA
jgi:formylglycine-generating enzyme required for sulfatase activity